MRNTLTRRSIVPTLALLRALVIGSCCAALAAAPALAAPATDGGEDAASVLSPARDVSSPGTTPTLTNDVGQPPGGSEAQLPLGLSLVGLGLAGLLFGLAAQIRTTRKTPIVPELHVGAWPVLDEPAHHQAHTMASARRTGASTHGAKR